MLAVRGSGLVAWAAIEVCDMKPIRTLALLLISLLATGCRRTDRDAIIVATWNIQHLAVRTGDGCHPRDASDYVELRRYADRLNADVIALQEVESAAAAARVFDPARYRIVMESRPPVPRRICNRDLPRLIRTPLAVGFAVRRGISLTRNPDVSTLGLGDPEQSWGVDITVRKPGGRPLRLLAVHLKAGCSDGRSRPACAALFGQQAVLARWAAYRVSERERFAELGDFNRVIGSRRDPFFRGLTGNGRTPLQFVVGARRSRCLPGLRPLADQIILGGGTERRWRDLTELPYRRDHRPLSDHCALRITLDG